MKLKQNHFLSGLTWRNNLYAGLLLRLLLVMLLFSVCRIGFFLFNKSFFPEVSLTDFLNLLLGGVVFDLSTMLYVNSLFILLMVIPFKIRFNYYYQLVLKYLFFITNGIAFAANVSDFIYYRFTLRRTTSDVFLQFENENNMGELWLRFFIDYWYAVLFWVLIMVVMIYLYNRIRITGPQLKNSRAFYLTGILAVPLIVWLIIGGMRGGFRHSTRPITLSNAGEYVRDPKHVSIVLNTPFAIMRTVGKTKIQKVNYYSPESVENIYTPVHLPVDTAAFTPQNVVVIILESFSKEFTGAFNREKHNGTYKGYTPFLDSLIRYSKTFQYSFANGRKSIDGLPSVVSSIPSLGVPYFLSPYSGNAINSLASTLKTKGYHTSFFHGAPNGSMGFKAFMNVAGVDEYYGMDEYEQESDFDGIWGIWDEKFLGFYGEKLSSFREPFFSTFFSVSSHHPFKVPQEYETKFKGGPLVIHKCIEYTDYGLKKFFDKIKDTPWYRNTLFVITADHTSSEIEFDETRTAWGIYSVPVIYFKPDHSLSGMDPSITQQIDIMPTILSYLHYDKPYVAFGRDAFDTKTEPFAFNYKDNNYQLYQGGYILQFNGTRSVGLYNFINDPLMKINQVEQLPGVVEKMEQKIKAIIQQYNNRLIQDELTLD